MVGDDGILPFVRLLVLTAYSPSCSKVEYTGRLGKDVVSLSRLPRILIKIEETTYSRLNLAKVFHTRYR
jgi:hypothetical protein